MKIKEIVKNVITFIRYPVCAIHLYKNGVNSLYIGKRMNIKKYRHFHGQGNLRIGDDARFLFIEEYNGKKMRPLLKISKNVYIGNRFSVLCGAPIEIGKNCLIASDVLIASENHGTNIEDYESFGGQDLNCKPIKIGNGCWIGEKVSILPGVQLGDRCVVGTGAVVTKSFPSYSMVAGVPAKVIKTYNFNTHAWEKVEAR